MRIVIGIAAVLLAGCGSVVVERGRSATPPYDDPLDASAAVGALECDGRTPHRNGEGVYDDGLAKVQESADAALDNYMSESGLSFLTPSDGYAVEREQGGRFQGAEHCSWTDITFLLVGPEEKADWYVRDTNDDLSELLRTTYDNVEAIPEGATDTGLRRDGRQLWIGPDEEAAYLVSLDDAQNVQRWPAAEQPIRCA